MYRKLLIATAVLAASSSVAFAGASYKGDYKGEAVAPAPCPMYQFMAGPYLGLSVGVLNNYTGTPVVYKGIQGTLSGGWGAMINPMFYLAGEVFIQDSANVKTYYDELTGTVSSRSTWGYGASIIPGYMITDHVLGYLRAGVVRTRFTQTGSGNTNATGWQVGLGGQTNVYQNWDLRGEYVYSQYQSISGIGKVGSDLFNLGVVYKFV